MIEFCPDPTQALHWIILIALPLCFRAEQESYFPKTYGEILYLQILKILLASKKLQRREKEVRVDGHLNKSEKYYLEDLEKKRRKESTLFSFLIAVVQLWFTADESLKHSLYEYPLVKAKFMERLWHFIYFRWEKYHQCPYIINFDDRHNVLHILSEFRVGISEIMVHCMHIFQ